ncbi:MAG TPA: hypothetical protein VGM02_07935 [Acidobacteriaceae bacterium]|jgi:hypothetical protein
MRALREFLVTIVNCIAVIIILALLLLMMPLLFWDDGTTFGRIARKIGRKADTPTQTNIEAKSLPSIQP